VDEVRRSEQLVNEETFRSPPLLALPERRLQRRKKPMEIILVPSNHVIKGRPDYKQVMKFREVACFYENENSTGNWMSMKYSYTSN
jgi:hypothetical protein